MRRGTLQAHLDETAIAAARRVAPGEQSTILRSKGRGDSGHMDENQGFDRDMNTLFGGMPPTPFLWIFAYSRRMSWNSFQLCETPVETAFRKTYFCTMSSLCVLVQMGIIGR